MNPNPSSYGVNLDAELSGAQAAEAELKHQIAAAQAAGESCEELETALADLRARFQELSGGLEAQAEALKQTGGAARALQGVFEKLSAAFPTISGLLTRLVNPSPDDAAGDRSETPAPGVRRPFPARVAEAQINAERAAVHCVETNPVERARKLHALEGKFSVRAGALDETDPLNMGRPAPSTAREQRANLERHVALTESGPVTSRETYRVPAPAVEKMGLAFGNAAADGHAATTAGNTTKMVSLLGTLVNKGGGTKTGTSLANDHAQ